jgi:hypothetical protein
VSGAARRRDLLPLAALAVPGCAGGPAAPACSGPRSATVHLVRRGWHTKLGVAVPDLRGRLQPLAASWPEAGDLLVGFGDRDYLLRAERGLGTLAGALLPGPGAMMVEALRVPPLRAFAPADALALAVTPEGLARLERHVAAAFAWDAADRPVLLARNGPAGAFYASALTYAGSFTCNTWVAAALAEAGLPFRSAGVVFADQVMAQGRALARPARDVTGVTS